MSKIIEKKKVTVVNEFLHSRSLEHMENLMSYLKSISEESIDNDVRKKILDYCEKVYINSKNSFIENRIETAVKPKNIGKNIADKIPFEIKIKRKEA